MITFTALKLLLGGWIKAISDFIAGNWRWLLPLLAALFLWWYISHLQDQRNDAVKALADHIQQDKAAADQREAENAAKETSAKAALDAQTAIHESEIDHIRRGYETRNGTDKKYLNDRVDAWRERLRLELQRQTAAGLPDILTPPGQPAESGENCNAAAARYDILATACQVTTSDYNALWQSWDKACAVFGCQ